MDQQRQIICDVADNKVKAELLWEMNCTLREQGIVCKISENLTSKIKAVREMKYTLLWKCTDS